jgi:hypothetical protein
MAKDVLEEYFGTEYLTYRRSLGDDLARVY